MQPPRQCHQLHCRCTSIYIALAAAHSIRQQRRGIILNVADASILDCDWMREANTYIDRDGGQQGVAVASRDPQAQVISLPPPSHFAISSICITFCGACECFTKTS